MGHCVHLALKVYFLVAWAAVNSFAKVVPFLDPGFFFDWNTPGEPVPITVTTQCETIHIEWGRSTATGPNPTAPYSLQIYTSTFVVPFLVDAGDALTFDWDVPFAPGTQYQICMFDINGIAGGCQAIYTVIQNTTVTNPTCQNVTFPTALDVVGTVDNGPMSQYGFVDQCTDISIKPKNGTPPYTLTVAPSLHPPYNITSNSMASINWTVSLSWASPFFMSLADSQGNVWANGPMHSGSGSTRCLNTDATPNNNTKSAAIGAGIGGVLGGLILGLVSVYIYQKYQYWRRESEMKFIPEKYTISSSDVEQRPRLLRTETTGSDTSTPTPTPDGTVHARKWPDRTSSRRVLAPDLPPTPSNPQGDTPTIDRLRSHIYVVHHDGGGPPVTVYTEREADVVELPPIYAEESRTQQTPTSDIEIISHHSPS